MPGIFTYYKRNTQLKMKNLSAYLEQCDHVDAFYLFCLVTRLVQIFVNVFEVRDGNRLLKVLIVEQYVLRQLNLIINRCLLLVNHIPTTNENKKVCYFLLFFYLIINYEVKDSYLDDKLTLLF